MLAPINKIIPFSNVDGLGNRLSIFFQGCPFTCLFCHNPETIHACIHCGICVKACQTKALTMQNERVVWQESRCVGCDDCLRACPHLSSPKVKQMSVADVLVHIHKVRPYIRGITVSGGECMMHADFLLELFAAVKSMGLTCLIDSNGAYPFQEYTALLELADGVMLDVKAVNPLFHQEVTGTNNNTVLENLRYLTSVNKLYEVRTVIYKTHAKQNETTIRYVAPLLPKDCTYQLIRYRPFGVRTAGIALFQSASCTDTEMQSYVALANACGASKTEVR